ncbi:MAG: ABC transporter ATP-binding protein [archaeon]
MAHPLVVKDLRKSYRSNGKSIEAVKGISFQVEKGDIFGFLGPNGAGKTTTINMLTGILTPDSGSIEFFGMKPCEATKQRINAATAYRSLSNHLTVEQNLKIYAKLYNVKDAKTRIEELLRKFEITDIRRQKIIDISSGQKTRVNICKGLINSPELLFLDEATAGLDPYIANVVRKEIKRLGITIVFTSHIMSEVEELCNKIAFINKGVIMKIDTPEEIKKLIKSKCLFIEFSGRDEIASLLGGFQITESDGNKIHIELNNNEEIQVILNILMKNNVKISDIKVKKPSLDEVFIKIAKGEL